MRQFYKMVDRAGYAPATSCMSSKHSTIELTVHTFLNKEEVFKTIKVFNTFSNFVTAAVVN